MGVKDQALLEYLKEIQRKKRLLLQNFSTKDAETVLLQSNDTKEKTQMPQQDAVIPSFLERERDFLMLYEKQGDKCYIGCEGQTRADYCMPVRELTYDGIEYSNQLEQLDCKPGTGKNKRTVTRPLVPIFNLILYLGETRWNSKHRLQEMMNIPELMKDFTNLLPEYRLHIVDIHEQDPEMFHTELKDIFRLMKHSRKKAVLKIYVEEHIEEIRKLSMDTRIFLSILLDQCEILESGKVEVKEMCQAWDGAMMMYYDEGVSYGISQGISQGIQETRRKNILRMLSKKKYSYEEISEINDATIEEVKELEMQLC